MLHVFFVGAHRFAVIPGWKQNERKKKQILSLLLFISWFDSFDFGKLNSFDFGKWDIN